MKRQLECTADLSQTWRTPGGWVMQRGTSAQRIGRRKKGPSGNIDRELMIDEMLRKKSTDLWCSFQGVFFVSLRERFDSFLLIPTRLGAEKLFG